MKLRNKGLTNLTQATHCLKLRAEGKKKYQLNSFPFQQCVSIHVLARRSSHCANGYSLTDVFLVPFKIPNASVSTPSLIHTTSTNNTPKAIQSCHQKRTRYILLEASVIVLQLLLLHSASNHGSFHQGPHIHPKSLRVLQVLGRQQLFFVLDAKRLCGVVGGLEPESGKLVGYLGQDGWKDYRKHVCIKAVQNTSAAQICWWESVSNSNGEYIAGDVFLLMPSSFST